MAEKFEIEEMPNLLSGEWRLSPEDKFKMIREENNVDERDRLTIILPKVAGKQRFLRLSPASEAVLDRDFLPREAILFPFSLAFYFCGGKIVGF